MNTGLISQVRQVRHGELKSLVQDHGHHNRSNRVKPSSLNRAGALRLLSYILLGARTAMRIPARS